ncbi:YceD family protein [Commensalibacter sp. Nvir]|uniref:YceD family protein n=1 Tax=Commensalibacter sp. Nvir TaxID=3069817 RepID=UPI0030C7A819
MIIEADHKEMQALAHRFSIPKIKNLKCFYQFNYLNEKNILVSGNLKAIIIQYCVLTLEELEEKIEEKFELLLVPKEKIMNNLESIEDPDLVPYSNNCIDLGEITAEQLALCINPYPHKVKTNDELFFTDDELKNESKNNSFAILANLQNKV